jgi:quinol monooxygenase YgiN
VSKAYEFANITVKEDAVAQFRSGIAEGAGIIARQPGCSSVDVWQCMEDPNEFVLHAAWDDVAAHDAFRESEDFPAYRATVQETFAARPTYKHYVRVTPV